MLSISTRSLHIKLLLSSFSLLCRVSKAYSKITNVTVDDQLGDSNTGAIPIYDPPENWNEGPLCTICSARLDPSQTFEGTWHDRTFTLGEQPSVITYKFNGQSSLTSEITY